MRGRSLSHIGFTVIFVDGRASPVSSSPCPLLLRVPYLLSPVPLFATATGRYGLHNVHRLVAALRSFLRKRPRTMETCRWKILGIGGTWRAAIAFIHGWLVPCSGVADLNSGLAG